MICKNKYVIDEDFLIETYDTEQLEMMEEEETRSLVEDLVDYSNELAQEVLKLRVEINQYARDLRMARKEDMRGYRPPYDDVCSDIFLNFAEHKVYDKFKVELDKMLD